MELPLTPSQTCGPFFHFCLTADTSAGRLRRPDAKGEHIQLAVRVLDAGEEPVDDAMIELWQADAGGSYGVDPAFSGFGRLATNEDGACVFETVRPGRVPGWDQALQAPHINVSVFARGLLKRVATRIYFAGDAANAEDPVLALVPADRRDTLLARPDPGLAVRWTFEIRLSGDGETVFFDI